uniref:Autophagy-related protein 9 n=1 Tax=Graphocephala atropunctata TaxID=36148 RepID=A0A1B6MNA5_9HEMI
MMAMMETSYQQFTGEPDDSEDTPQELGPMIHIVPESGKAARWNHVEDLDSFFTRNYLYHQKHGFKCITLQEVFELVQFIFVLMLSTFLLNCVDYQILFRNNETNQTATQRKIDLNDALVPVDQCVANVEALWWLIIFVAVVFWLIRAIRVIYHLFHYWNIKSFFNSALKIQDAELDNVTWHEVQKRIREVQLEQQMCIHKKDLTELDIYHRILRFKNYMVAMVNKSLLPVRFSLPVLGSVIYFTHGLKYNINFLLFWGPWSPFQNNWHLKEDYKKVNKRQELAQQLSKHIFYVAVVNLALCPVILMWQILYSFFNYAEAIKREPGSLGIRCWSQYGRLYLRHFNELDHELHARLNRAYRPASKYMSIFTSPVMTIIAKNVVFVSGSILAILLALTVYDQDVLTVDHVLTAITVLGIIMASFRVFIPDENLVRCPETLMTAILAQVHYVPDSWRGNAHTSRVRDELSQLFQYKATYLVEELLSPVITPLVLFFYLRPKALDIVDFFRNFTVEVVGVGDVCSFAQMDVRRHGNPAWQTNVTPAQPPAPANQYNQAEDGKTELSLVHFTVTNPNWQPPSEAETFVSALRTQVRRDAVMPGAHLLINDNSLSSLGIGLSEMLMRPGAVPPPPAPLSPVGTIHMRTSRAEGPIYNPQVSWQEPDNETPETEPLTDMSLSTLYLHAVHHRQVRQRGYHEGSVWFRGPSSSRTQERTPLIPRPS